MRYAVLLILALSFGCSPAVDAKLKRTIADVVALLEREEKIRDENRELMRATKGNADSLSGKSDELSLKLVKSANEDYETSKRRYEEASRNVEALEAELKSLR